ncbi:GNAT superfamily N-acetyltransferase [Kribbella aluminosa]|uniref:GNAT superfamily N-acetyltransferase n=1 Tax=Kribbella aluminosa TaxID=416017 RepID=A0ABS4UHS7_9ACTN|nr:GNAT family N-acetyltransferase [Kribbella aluminosa]MBP2351192.1 GNAT superfamily N-acetyltransferase [Kribbella aluminosa]
MDFRVAGSEDAAAVAELHGDSWRRHYRGAYADAFLDDESPEYLGAMWAKRLADRDGTRTTVAEYDGQLIGLAHVVFDADPAYGALVDNLHVRAPLKGQGIGTELLARAATGVPTGLYLWVLEQNTAAQAFYEARGGIRGDRRNVPPPGGEPRRLNGTPVCLRYYWPDPVSLTVSINAYDA